MLHEEPSGAYEGRRRCDATERAPIGDFATGRRGPL